MNSVELKKYLLSDDFVFMVNFIYHINDAEFIAKQRKRYEKILDEAIKLYGDGDYHYISSPGRTEICGNHTDHQNGMVVAASINLDNVCIVKKSDDNIVRIADEVFKMNEVNLSNLEMYEEEKNTTKSIIRGIAARLKTLGYNIGGFSAYQDINVLVGSGLSSSACFEVLITEIYNYYYNDEKITDIDRAIISQWAENNYFGKPCGLMDQMAISVGSFVNIDFKDKAHPIIKKLDFNFDDYNYDLFVINTKANHVDLTSEYASMPIEMKKVAKYFGKEVLSEIEKKVFYENIKEIREKIKNDRALLRAIHYYDENDRVKDIVAAIENKDIVKVLEIINLSGDSSYKFLQNVYVGSDAKYQPMSFALSLSKDLKGKSGASRVHGGGFAGTMLVIVKKDLASDYIKQIKNIFGEDAILKLYIRSVGTRMIV